MPKSRDLHIPAPPSDETYNSSPHASDADDELDDTSEDMTDGTNTDTNDDMSLNGASSPAPSMNPSLYSYHSSVDGNVLLKDVYGRTMNNVSEVRSQYFGSFHSRVSLMAQGN